MIIVSHDLVTSPSFDRVEQGTPWIAYRNLPTEGGSITTTTAAVGFPASKLLDPSTHQRWRGTSATADEYITASFSPFHGWSYFAVAGHNFGSIGAMLSVAYHTTGDSPNAWVQVIAPTLAVDDAPILFRWTPVTCDGARLRIQQVGGSPPSLPPPEAAVVYTGDPLLIMERGIDIENDHVPLKFGHRANIVSGMSESGNFLGRIVVSSYLESRAEFKHITPAFYRSSIEPFINFSKLKPFFWVWNPLEYPSEVGYAWMTNEPQPATSPITRRVALTFEMRGIT
jgi:hypothetical protein